MDDLRELDIRCAELLGYEVKYTSTAELMGIPISLTKNWYIHIGEGWKPVPAYSTDPAACAEMDEEMRKRGYYLGLLRRKSGEWAARYCRHDPYIEVGYIFCTTECEARTRAAVRALEGSGEK